MPPTAFSDCMAQVSLPLNSNQKQTLMHLTTNNIFHFLFVIDLASKNFCNICQREKSNYNMKIQMDEKENFIFDYDQNKWS